MRVSAISAASPDMSEEEFNALVEDIRERGQIVPIVKSGDEIIDGRKRFRACRELGIEPKAIDLSPNGDPVAFSHSLNVLRTHYTPSQRAMFASTRANATRATGAERRRVPDDLQSCRSSTTVSEAAARAGVSPRAVALAKAVRRDGAPEVVAAVQDGTLTLHAAEQIVSAVPKAHQAQAVEKVIEGKRGRQKHRTARDLGTRAVRVYKSIPANEQRDRAMKQLENAAAVLEETEGRALPPPEQVQEWLVILGQVLPVIRKFHNLLKGGH